MQQRNVGSEEPLIAPQREEERRPEDVGKDQIVGRIAAWLKAAEKVGVSAESAMGIREKIKIVEREPERQRPGVRGERQQNEEERGQKALKKVRETDSSAIGSSWSGSPWVVRVHRLPLPDQRATPGCCGRNSSEREYRALRSDPSG